MPKGGSASDASRQRRNSVGDTFTLTARIPRLQARPARACRPPTCTKGQVAPSDGLQQPGTGDSAQTPAAVKTRVARPAHVHYAACAKVRTCASIDDVRSVFRHGAFYYALMLARRTSHGRSHRQGMRSQYPRVRMAPSGFLEPASITSRAGRSKMSCDLTGKPRPKRRE